MAASENAWTCRRCGQADAPRIDFEPWPGDLGREVRETVCSSCWNEWMMIQTRILNEYRVNVLHPDHVRAVREQMCRFFDLPLEDKSNGE